jgi:ribose/xylose/arabinose/galactoside ABC-type transport system permease subunit
MTFALIGNGLNLLGVDTTYQLTILGLLIFAAVAADQIFRRKKA